MIRHNETKRRLEMKDGRERLIEFRALLAVDNQEMDKADDDVHGEDELPAEARETKLTRPVDVPARRR